MARTILRLYLIHCSAILAIAFSMYFPGLDLLLSFLYLALLWQEASRSIYKSQPIKQGLIGFLWQMPGIILVLAVCLGWDFSVDFSYYFIFMLSCGKPRCCLLLVCSLPGFGMPNLYITICSCSWCRCLSFSILRQPAKKDSPH